jgi:hypothetical protein
MDFKSLINKIESIDGKIETPKAPELPKTVQLDESASLRVLAGQTSYVTEAKKKAEEKKEEKKEVEEGFDADAKVGDTFKTAKGTATKTASGVKHTKDKYDYDPGSDDKDDKKRKETARKAKKESIDPEAFKEKFTKMIEGKKGSKPDFLDMDKDGDKKEPMKKAVADKKGSKPKKGVNPFAKKTESAMMPKGKKRPVKESVETKLTFKDMVQLVQESGGQQQIDAIDKELFNWAQRVAVSKLGEGMKSELYAGLIYERNGGVFEMYDVLSEDQK